MHWTESDGTRLEALAKRHQTAIGTELIVCDDDD